MRIENIELSFQQIAKDKKALLIGVRPYQLYVNGQRTDQVGGTTYEAVLPNHKFEKISVKVELADQEAIITQEEIDESDAIYITFDGFIGKFYRNQAGFYNLSCKAQRAHLTDEGGK